ncbi:MAG: WD40 repeat domain-containing protein [Leptolyngbyaceae bacterium]|nr:WD40 repeat domain-containing protein [Leptolyngbyaceae bacterium]
MSRLASQQRPSASLFSQQWQVQLADYVTVIAFSPDGQHLATSSAAGDIWLGHPREGLHLLQASQGRSVDAIAFSANSQFLAAAGQGGNLWIWDIVTSDIPASHMTKNLGKGWIDCLAWHPTESVLAIATGSHVQLWQMTTCKMLAELDFERSSVLDLAWHPQGTHLAVGGQGGVSVWTAADWRTPPEFTPVPGASIAVQWSAAGRYLASGNLDHTLMVVDWGNPPPWYMQGFPGKVRQVVWSDLLTKMDAPLLAATCMDAITIWQREAKESGVWRNRVLQEHEGRVEVIAFQPNSFNLLSAGADGALRLWPKAKTNSQILSASEVGWGAIAWSPDGQQLVGGDRTGLLTAWGQSQRGHGFQSKRSE